MGFFTEQQLRIDIDEENAITIRRMNYGQRQAGLSKASKASAATQDISLDFALLQSEEIVHRIVSWEGPGFESKPVTKENILALPPWVVDKVKAKADEWDAQLSEEEKK